MGYDLPVGREAAYTDCVTQFKNQWITARKGAIDLQRTRRCTAQILQDARHRMNFFIIHMNDFCTSISRKLATR